jgi:hypothetical protein
MALKIITSPSGARFTVNAEHADRFQALVNDLEARGYPIKGEQSGGYNPRNIAGTNTPSKHSHGDAIDINWSENARGAPGKIPQELALELAQKNGLTWGGTWKNRDDMHFEVAGHSPNDGHDHGPRTATPTAPTPSGEQPMIPALLASLLGIGGTAAAGTAAAGTAAAGTAAGTAGQTSAAGGGSSSIPFSMGGGGAGNTAADAMKAAGQLGSPLAGLGQHAQPSQMPDMSRLMAVLQQRRRFG